MPDERSIQIDEDTYLMRKVKEGDRQAYARLYEKYVPVVTKYIARHNGHVEPPEDLAQEVFLRVWCCRARYEPLAPMKDYLFGIAANVLRESQANARGQVRFEIVELEALVDTSLASPLVDAELEEQVRVVQVLMGGLPDRQRKALKLIYLAEVSVAEAARIMGCSTECARKHLSVARQRLTKLLDR